MGSVRKADQKLVDEILKSLETNDRAVLRAMWLLAKRQTQDELAQEATLVHNGQGFSSAHARFGAFVYGRLKAGQTISQKTLNTARKITKQYARTQLLEMAKARLEQERSK